MKPLSTMEKLAAAGITLVLLGLAAIAVQAYLHVHTDPFGAFLVGAGFVAGTIAVVDEIIGAIRTVLSGRPK